MPVAVAEKNAFKHKHATHLNVKMRTGNLYFHLPCIAEAMQKYHLGTNTSAVPVSCYKR